MKSKEQRILVLAPHVDDGEFGCGGTIHRLVREGHTVRYIAFSDCKDSIPKGMNVQTLSNEMKAATSRLGIDNKELFDFPVRKFNSYRQEILELLVKENHKFQPDTIFTPCTKDIHQDHETLTNEAIRAFKCSTIYGYELPWNLLELPSSAFFALEKEDVDAKISAIMAYKSQQHRSYSNEEYIRSLATTRGVRIKTLFAEAFEAIRVVNK